MRRGLVRVAALLLVIVAGVVIVVVAKRPDQDENAAASAAKVAIFDTDADPGENASCEFDPGIGLVVLRAEYDCVARTCTEEFARVRITHQLLGGWTYNVTSGAGVGTPTSGRTVLSESEPSHFDPRDCR